MLLKRAHGSTDAGHGAERGVAIDRKGRPEIGADRQLTDDELRVDVARLHFDALPIEQEAVLLERPTERGALGQGFRLEYRQPPERIRPGDRGSAELVIAVRILRKTDLLPVEAVNHHDIGGSTTSDPDLGQ